MLFQQTTFYQIFHNLHQIFTLFELKYPKIFKGALQ